MYIIERYHQESNSFQVSNQVWDDIFHIQVWQFCEVCNIPW